MANKFYLPLLIFCKIKFYKSSNNTSFIKKIYGRTFIYDENLFKRYSNCDDFIKFNIFYLDFFEKKKIDKTKIDFFLYICNNSNKYDLKYFWHPYVAAKRIINYIYIFDNFSEINIQILKIHYFYISKQLEYKVLTNHYLTNLNALFLIEIVLSKQNKNYKKLFLIESTKQINSDGFHYELSISYHTEILLDLLKTIKVSKILNLKDITSYLTNIANQMFYICKLFYITDNVFPLFGDSYHHPEFSLKKINLYNLNHFNSTANNQNFVILNNSGFLYFKNTYFNFFFKFKNFLPKHNPGHSHSDILSFELFSKFNRLIVDKGNYSYHKKKYRYLVRSSNSHNGATVNKYESSQIWSKFRCGKSANLVNFHYKYNDHKIIISASHDGYIDKGIIFNRKLLIFRNKLMIKDSITGNSNLFSIFNNIILNVEKVNIVNNKFCNFFYGSKFLKAYSTNSFIVKKTLFHNTFYQSQRAFLINLYSNKKNYSRIYFKF